MAHLRTPVETIKMAIKVKGKGLGVRAPARVLGASPSIITKWEEHLSAQLFEWSPKALPDGNCLIKVLRTKMND